MSGITTHVLDVAQGRPAAGIAVTLEGFSGGAWRMIGQGVTDGDGRLRTLLAAGAPLDAGEYRLTFDTGVYNPDGFYPTVSIAFTIRNPGEHYHVPLLLSPFGYSTYRGS
jgi:5-hydroxyisourate hydrolase